MLGGTGRIRHGNEEKDPRSRDGRMREWERQLLAETVCYFWSVQWREASLIWRLARGYTRGVAQKSHWRGVGRGLVCLVE